MVKNKGTIKFVHDKGYGFIIPADGGDDVFFHIKQIQGTRDPAKNDEVEFGTSMYKGRIVAININIINKYESNQTELFEEEERIQ